MKVAEQKAEWWNVRDVRTFMDLAGGRYLKWRMYVAEAKVQVNEVWLPEVAGSNSPGTMLEMEKGNR